MTLPLASSECSYVPTNPGTRSHSHDAPRIAPQSTTTPLHRSWRSRHLLKSPSNPPLQTTLRYCTPQGATSQPSPSPAPPFGHTRERRRAQRRAKPWDVGRRRAPRHREPAGGAGRRLVQAAREGLDGQSRRWCEPGSGVVGTARRGDRLDALELPTTSIRQALNEQGDEVVVAHACRQQLVESGHGATKIPSGGAPIPPSQRQYADQRIRVPAPVGGQMEKRALSSPPLCDPKQLALADEHLACATACEADPLGPSRGNEAALMDRHVGDPQAGEHR